MILPGLLGLTLRVVRACVFFEGDGLGTSAKDNSPLPPSTQDPGQFSDLVGDPLWSWPPICARGSKHDCSTSRSGGGGHCLFFVAAGKRRSRSSTVAQGPMALLGGRRGSERRRYMTDCGSGLPAGPARSSRRIRTRLCAMTARPRCRPYRALGLATWRLAADRKGTGDRCLFVPRLGHRPTPTTAFIGGARRIGSTKVERRSCRSHYLSNT